MRALQWMSALLLSVAMMVTARADEGAPAATTIEWDAGTLRLVERDGSYGRMVRLGDRSIACAFDRGGKLWVRRSSDEGMTWAAAVLVAEEAGSWLTNSELLPLASGELLYFWNDRPIAALKQHGRP